MTYYLDTNICIYFLNGTSARLRDRLLSENPRDISIPSIVKAELLFGAEKSRRRDENLERVHQFLFPLPIADFGDAESIVYAKIRAHLEINGEPIGPNDLIIAATTVASNGILVTHNTGEFGRVPDLRVDDWMAF